MPRCARLTSPGFTRSPPPVSAAIEADYHYNVQLAEGELVAGTTSAGGGPVDCENNPVDPIFKFDRHTGKVLANFGKGVMVTP